VLLNLLVNAESAMEGTQVRHLSLTTQRKQGTVQIMISDTGHGMAPVVSQRVFEPFFTTKPPGEGTGLGLSVSYGIIQAHQGTISVDSTPEVGTTFTIVLTLYTEAKK
jgi:C4-dicarboxylate-specific signal transduction histidine kinase